jgi:hypothetical protein
VILRVVQAWPATGTSTCGSRTSWRVRHRRRGRYGRTRDRRLLRLLRSRQDGPGAAGDRGSAGAALSPRRGSCRRRDRRRSGGCERTQGCSPPAKVGPREGCRWSRREAGRLARECDRVGPRKSVRLSLACLGLGEQGFGGFLSRGVDRSSRGRSRACFRHPPRRPTSCRSGNRNGLLRSEFVFVKQAAEPVAPTDTPLVLGWRDGPRCRQPRRRPPCRSSARAAGRLVATVACVVGRERRP